MLQQLDVTGALASDKCPPGTSLARLAPQLCAAAHRAALLDGARASTAPKWDAKGLKSFGRVLGTLAPAQRDPPGEAALLRHGCSYPWLSNISAQLAAQRAEDTRGGSGWLRATAPAAPPTPGEGLRRVLAAPRAAGSPVQSRTSL